MADKYLIHGATYCGDGTTSAQAASNGAAGAWNNINVLEGTAPAYGTLAAGDTVYIRSKTSAGADITRTLAAGVTLGSANGTEDSMITWVLDNGEIWSGINGTLTYESPSNYLITLQNHNSFVCLGEDKWVLKDTVTNWDYKAFIALNPNTQLENLFLDMSSNTHYIGSRIVGVVNGRNIFRNIHIKANRWYGGLLAFGEFSNVQIYSPRIELVNTYSDGGGSIFHVNNYGSKLLVVGGRIYGAGATSGSYVCACGATDGTAQIVGTVIPREMALHRTTPPTQSYSTFKVDAFGLEEGGAGGGIVENWGVADSRGDNYYPTLNAFIKASTDKPWSWNLYPRNASNACPMRIPTAKLYTADAAIKTLTANVLVSDSWGAGVINKRTLWLEVTYVDATTGERRSLTTRKFTGGALASSTATWTATTYGPRNLTKQELTITTPTTIKKDTVVTATLMSSARSVSDNDVFVFCPDLGIS